MLIGLSGTSGSGKTTLCQGYVKRHKKVKFYPTNASEIFKLHGIDPSKNLNIETRLFIQEKLLESFNEDFEGYSHMKGDVVVDRTPADLIGYLFAQNTQSSVTNTKNEDRFFKLIEGCYKSLNDNFSAVVMLQPGILSNEQRQGKALSNRAYSEKVTALIAGTLYDARTSVAWYSLDRECLELNDRIDELHEIIKGTREDYKLDLDAYLEEGSFLH